MGGDAPQAIVCRARVSEDKDLTLVPFLVALEAQRAGLWLRSVSYGPSSDLPSRRTAAVGTSRRSVPTCPNLSSIARLPDMSTSFLFAKSPEYEYHPTALNDLNGDRLA